MFFSPSRFCGFFLGSAFVRWKDRLSNQQITEQQQQKEKKKEVHRLVVFRVTSAVFFFFFLSFAHLLVFSFSFLSEPWFSLSSSASGIFAGALKTSKRRTAVTAAAFLPFSLFHRLKETAWDGASLKNSASTSFPFFLKYTSDLQIVFLFYLLVPC